jgi:hypothetical protein
MAAHATGHLHGLLRNLERDEVKHLGIISAADTYLLGPRPWRRFLELVRKGLENYAGQKRSRSGGGVFGTNPITAIEGIAAHLLTELFLRRWLRTIPLRTLAVVFETPPGLPEPGGAAHSPARQAEIDESMRREKAKREALSRWRRRQKREALSQLAFDASHEVTIERLIGGELGGFEGAEVAGSAGDKRRRQRIQHVTQSRGSMIRMSLLGRLRRFQIERAG